jgi:RNA polymerase sigma-70 factor (ECF subfamily)
MPSTPAPTSTFGLVERFKNGDEEAFTLLFEKYRRRLAVLVYYKLSEELRGSIEVDDVMQETFFAAARDAGNFTYRVPGSFLSWLARIAEHVIIDEARAHSRKKRHAEELVRFRSESNPGGAEPVDSQTPSRILAQEEGVRGLLERLNALPEDYRQVILLAKVEGLTTQEVAERLGKTREATAVLLHRAVKKIKKVARGE